MTKDEAFWWSVLLGRETKGPVGLLDTPMAQERPTRQPRRHAERQARKRQSAA